MNILVHASWWTHGYIHVGHIPRRGIYWVIGYAVRFYCEFFKVDLPISILNNRESSNCFRSFPKLGIISLFIFSHSRGCTMSTTTQGRDFYLILKLVSLLQFHGPWKKAQYSQVRGYFTSIIVTRWECKYSIRNRVRNTVITMCGVRWVLDSLGWRESLHVLYGCIALSLPATHTKIWENCGEFSLNGIVSALGF